MNQNNLIEEIVSILKKREKQEVFAKIEKFCTERLDNLRKNITPMSPFKEGSKTVLHLIPLDSVLNPKNYDLFANASNRALLMPMQAGSFEGHYNIHGMLNLSIIENAENPPSIPGYLKYVQAFTNGTIEAVDGAFRGNGLNIIARELEETIISSASDYLKFQAGLKIEPPILLCLALLGTKGCLISPDQ